MIDKIWCLFFLLLPAFLAAQESREIRGLVTDEQGRPMIGVNILNKQTQTGAASDLEGRFAISARTGDTLSFSFVGYTSLEMEVTEGQPLPMSVRLETGPSTDLQVVEINALRMPVEARSPAPIMTLHPEDLQRDDNTSIRPALNRVPGVLMHSGSLNTNRITIRGIGNRSPFATAKIRAYFNDIPLTNGVGETTLEDIDLNLFDEIVIWKGPTASSYGAGLGGMIHLRSDPAYSRDGLNAQVEGTYGSFGTRRLAAGLQLGGSKGTGGGGWNTQLHYHNFHSDGYRENNRYNRQGVSLQANYTCDKGNTTSLLANYIGLKAFIPSSLNEEDYLNDPQKAAFTWAQIKGFEDSKKILLGASHRHHLIRNEDRQSVLENITSLFGTWYDNYESRPFNILTEDNSAFGGRSRFILHPGGAPNLSIQAGGELFVEKYNWQTYQTDGGRQDTLLSDNKELRTYYNLFAETAVDFTSGFRLEAGFNFNQSRYKLTDKFLVDGNDQSGDYSFAAIFSPRIGLLYRLPHQLGVFGNISHGFAPPTLEETLAPEGGINPEIQPEKGWNFELGFRRNDPVYRFNFEITVYSLLIDDLLVARRTALDQYVGINAGSTVHSGLETYLQYRFLLPSKDKGNEISVFANYTYSHYRFKTFIDGENDYSGNELTGTPPHVLNLGLDFNPLGSGLYGYLNFNYVDAMPIRDDNTVYSDPYQVMNFKLGYKFTVPISEGKSLLTNVFAGVNNIWNEKYASMHQVNAAAFGNTAPRYYYPGLPRNYYVGLRFLFGK